MLREGVLESGSELRAGTCCKGVLNSILPNTQSINRLNQVSQLCPRTILQSESNGVTYNVIGVTSLEVKWIDRLVASVIMVAVVPSNRQRVIGGTE